MTTMLCGDETVRILLRRAFPGIGARGACQKVVAGCGVYAIGLGSCGESERSLLGLDTIVLVVLLSGCWSLGMEERCLSPLDRVVCAEIP